MRYPDMVERAAPIAGTARNTEHDFLFTETQHGIATMEATAAAEDEWTSHVAEVANESLMPQANSWYMGANIPRQPRVFMPYLGGVGPYREKCNEVAATGYGGFSFAS